MKKIFCLTLAVITVLLSLISCDNNSDNNNENKVINVHKNETQLTYTVKFETNGGTSISNISKINKIDEAPFTTKENHIFDGWFLDSTLTQAAIFPLTIEKDTTLYARWLKVQSKLNCTSTKVKLDKDIGPEKIYQITPSGFDINRLQQLGYTKIKINIYYTVRYEKDYDVLWDIGYMGSPKYEVSLVNSQKIGEYENNVSTTTKAKEKTINTDILLSNITSDQITLSFSTDNIQNIIFFENIVVKYECVK